MISKGILALYKDYPPVCINECIEIPIPQKRDGYEYTYWGKQLELSFLCTANCPDSQSELSVVATSLCLPPLLTALQI